MARALWASKVPSNINPLSPTGFRFNIAKLPEVEFFCQEVNLPDITLGEVTVNTPLSRMFVPGETLDYGTLEVQFLIDEEMRNFRSIKNWITALGFPEDHSQYSNYISQDEIARYSELARSYSEATLSILTNNNNESKIVVFRNLFPINLAGLQFTSTEPDVNYLVGRASFRFTFYEFL
jgi:hypothetical protein